MGKRERENPCGICGHYHKFEEGEICGVCGHRLPIPSEKTPVQVSAFPSEILPDFLYLGSYDNASRSELLKSQGIYRILNAVPSCQNLYKNSFSYYCLEDDKGLQFDDANRYLEQCEQEKARVLVHCMSGKNRSPAIVIAYLMKSRGWRLPQSYQWVKDRRPSIDLNQAFYQQLQEYEQKIFGSEKISHILRVPSAEQGFSFGFPKTNDMIPVPAFNSPSAASIFARPVDVPLSQFTFGACHTQNDASEQPLTVNSPNPQGGDFSMDST